MLIVSYFIVDGGTIATKRVNTCMLPHTSGWDLLSFMDPNTGLRLPNDEIEQERLDLNHHIFRMCLGGELHLSPVKDPKRILDLGTGTGTWFTNNWPELGFANQYTRNMGNWYGRVCLPWTESQRNPFTDTEFLFSEFPDAYIIGNDLSAIQPSKVPPNLIFEIDDCESMLSNDTRDCWNGDWQGFYRSVAIYKAFWFRARTNIIWVCYSIHQTMGSVSCEWQPLIHTCRSDWLLTFNFSAIRDWPALYAQAYQNLNPGGWFEATDSE